MNQVILFDIDLTLFNTDSFRILYTDKLIEHTGFPRSTITQLQTDYLSTLESSSDFHPNSFLEFLSVRLSLSKRELDDLYYSPDNFYGSVYPDVRPALSRLQSKTSLGIFSEGFADFQILKLHKSGILQYFTSDLIFIFRRKITPDSLKHLPKGSLVIDDRPTVIHRLENSTVFPLWLNRSVFSFPYHQRTINSLSELSYRYVDFKNPNNSSAKPVSALPQ